MATNKFKLISFTVLITLSTLGLIDAQNCEIRESKRMLDLIEEITSLLQSVVRMLKSYQCDLEEKSLKVRGSDILLTINNTDENNEEKSILVKPTIPRPPDVTNHTNFHLLSSISDCGIIINGKRILNGYKTVLFEFPWMALLSYQTRNGQEFLCEGTLINERYVLTAAHCITNFNNHTRLKSVRLGEYNISSEQDCERESRYGIICSEPVQDILIEEAIPHPNYNCTTYSHDIGLLRLSSPAQLKDSVKPICLPVYDTLKNKNFTDAKLVVTGWSSTETVRKSKDLLKVEVPIISEAECKTAYSQTTAVINYRQLCAGSRNSRNFCIGNNGGPLQSLQFIDGDIRFIQFGVESFGNLNCGQEGFPGVYTRVDYYMDWILDNMRT